MRLNQEAAPNDLSADGAVWQDLGGLYSVTSGTLVVRLRNNANEYVIADAVRIERVSGPNVQVIDNGHPGFRTGGEFTPFAGQGFQGDVHYSAAGSGADSAEWTFAVTPGVYRVSVTWSPDPNRASNAPFTVLDGAVALAMVPINQELAPNDLSDAGVMWEDLGTFTLSSLQLTVRLTDLANEYVIADAVRIERIG